MKKHELLNKISYALTDADELYQHFIHQTEDEEIGDVWYFVIGFKNDTDFYGFENNTFELRFEPGHNPEDEKNDLLKNGFTDIYSMILI